MLPWLWSFGMDFGWSMEIKCGNRLEIELLYENNMGKFWIIIFVKLIWFGSKSVLKGITSLSVIKWNKNRFMGICWNKTKQFSNRMGRHQIRQKVTLLYFLYIWWAEYTFPKNQTQKIWITMKKKKRRMTPRSFFKKA